MQSPRPLSLCRAAVPKPLSPSLPSSKSLSCSPLYSRQLSQEHCLMDHCLPLHHPPLVPGERQLILYGCRFLSVILKKVFRTKQCRQRNFNIFKCDAAGQSENIAIIVWILPSTLWFGCCFNNEIFILASIFLNYIDFISQYYTYISINF